MDSTAHADFLNLQLGAVGPLGSPWVGKAVPFGEMESGNATVSIQGRFLYDFHIRNRFHRQGQLYLEIELALDDCRESLRLATDPKLLCVMRHTKTDLNMAKLRLMIVMLETEDDLLDMLDRAVAWHKTAHTNTFQGFTLVFQRPWNKTMLRVLDGISAGIIKDITERTELIASRDKLHQEMVEALVEFALWWLENTAMAHRESELQFQIDGIAV